MESIRDILSNYNAVPGVADALIKAGLHPIPIPAGTKGPKGKGWQEKDFGPESFRPGSNVGLRHDNIAMIDKDCPEVLITARAFLPETLTTGKESTPDAHSWYIPTGGVPKFTPFKDVDGDMIIELRFDSGHQTLIPPSVHPEGERYVVGSAAEVREWDAAEMRRGVGMAATAALIARHLPPGGRHDIAKHIMGYLQRNGESEEDALAICEAAWEVVDAPAEAFRDLRTLGASTAQKLSDEKPVSGGKKLGEEWDEKLPGKIAEFLGWEEKNKELTEEDRKALAEQAWPVCKAVAMRPDITAAFAETLHSNGVAGESKQIRLLYLAIVSRLLEKQVNVAVKGPSSGGKSYLIESVLKAFPESAYYDLSTMSEKALIYLDEDMRHRYLVIAEASGMQGDMQSYLIRTLLSEGRIRYQTAEATAKGVKPRLLEMEGPTGLLVSTTATRLHPENETRLFSLLVTDTPEQTKGVFKALAEQKRKPASLEQWRALQTWLEGQRNEVVVPYAPALAELVPPLAVRLRRDFRAVLLLIQAHAVLHQAQRQRDEDGWIVATLDDYRIVRHLVGEMVAEGIGAGVSDTVRETVEAVRTLTAEEGADEVDGEKVTSAKKVAGVLGVDKTATSRRIKSAVDGGYLKDLREHKNRPQKLAIGDPLPEKQDVLPDPDELLEKAIELGWVVHESEGIPSNGSNGGSGLQNGNNNPEQPNNPDGGNVDSSLINHCKNDDEVSVSTPNGTVKSDVLAKTRVGSDRSATGQPSIKKGLKRRRRRATQPTVQPSVQPSNPESEGDVDPLAERKARREGRILDALDAMYFNHEDRYHELPEGERKLIRAWVSDNAAPRNVTRPRDSYELKHVAEQFLGFYVSNASIKGALLEAGYEPAWSGPINMGFRVGPLPGSDWEDKPYGPRTLGPSLLYTPAYIPEYPASRARRQKQWLRK